MNRRERGDSSRLRVVETGALSLGARTIMDPVVAARHGVAYIHLAAFAIDVDRIRVEVEVSAEWPFAWEVFLTERYLIAHFDPAHPAHRELLEDTCASILEPGPGGDALGAQIVFAIGSAIARGVFPADMIRALPGWRKDKGSLQKDLAVLWAEEQSHAGRLAHACLAFSIDPPLSEPARAALHSLATTA